jgi:hypothetical protein
MAMYSATVKKASWLNKIESVTAVLVPGLYVHEYLRPAGPSFYGLQNEWQQKRQG